MGYFSCYVGSEEHQGTDWKKWCLESYKRSAEHKVIRSANA